MDCSVDMLIPYPFQTAYKCNVGDYTEIENTFNQVAKDFGKYDIVVANSGVQQTTSCLDMTPQQVRLVSIGRRYCFKHRKAQARADHVCSYLQWGDIVQVNFNGVFYCCQIAARFFKAQGIAGNIVVRERSTRCLQGPVCSS